jgi:hypothetical protein
VLASLGESLAQLFRKADRAALLRWSRYLGRLLLALAATWLLFTGWAVVVAIAGASGVDPSQKATLLAAGISESMNCIAAMIVFLLLPTIVVLVVRRRTGSQRKS